MRAELDSTKFMNDSYQVCLHLMETVLEYRREPIARELEKVRHKHSMLHIDVLLLIYYFAKITSGPVLEIGAYLGGGTIAAAWGVRDSGKRRAIISIEPGGACEHPRLPTKNILKDLKKNLAKRGVAEQVTLLEGFSRDKAVTAAVKERIEPGMVDLLIIDADGDIEGTMDLYGSRLAPDCWIVIDDYYCPAPGSKDVIVRPQIHALVRAGQLETLGFYGWATWVGRWRGSERSDQTV
jgi:predicted O-methyltransferase YrrM